MAIRELETRYKEERENFGKFVQTFFKLYHNKEFTWNWHYEKICHDLEDLYHERIKLLIINIPPQTGKTEIVSKLFTIWCMGNAGFRIMNTGYSANLTKMFSVQARDYYDSRAFRMIFPRAPRIKYHAVEMWGSLESYYRPTGYTGTITGVGCDLYVIDDPVNPTDVMISGLSMNKINTWFSGTARSRLSPKGKRLMVVVMQRLHDNDLTGYLTRRFKDRFDNGSWRLSSIDAEVDEHGNSGSFFPELLSDKDLVEKRDEMTSEYGSNYYAAQYRQNPLDVDSSEFTRKNFQYYSEKDEIDWRDGYIAVDPAISEKQTADNSAIVAVGRDKEGRFYRRAFFKGRVSPDVLIKEIFAMQSAFNYPVVIETVSAFKILAQNLRKEMVRTGKRFNLIEVSPRGNKHERIRSTLSVVYNNNSVFHRKEDEYSDFEDELIRFPKGRHDDEIDAFEMAISQFSYGNIKKRDSDLELKIEKLKSQKSSPVSYLFNRLNHKKGKLSRRN